MEVKITVLVNDYTALPRVKGEHGLSLLLETPGYRLLFDTGQGSLFYENARIMGKTIEEVDALVLSHNHYDHTGGLPKFLEINKKAKIYSHPQTFRNSYSKHLIHSKNSFREIGLSEDTIKQVERLEGRVIKNTTPLKVDTNLMLTGQIPRKVKFEKVDSSIFTDRNLTIHDTIPDDQALIVFGEKEFLLLLGCCHSGVINTIEHVKTLLPNHNLRAIFGGTHLITADEERIKGTIDYLKKFNNLFIYHGHCTGFKAGCALNAAFPKNSTYFATGEEYTFDIL